MKHLIRVSSLWLIALLACLMLAGCGPAGPQPAPTPATGASNSAEPSASPTAVAARNAGEKDLILATTTSTQDSGLLDVLIPMFEAQSGYNVKTISVGTGAALALGARGEADVVLVHAPRAEKEWMAQGNGTERLLVMHNDFVVVGPADDPARLQGTTRAVDALKKIADAGSVFVSRGDSSGTHQLEQQLWRESGIAPAGQPWYVESGTGMGQTLAIADQRRAYSISDRATWLARRDQLALPILIQGDPALFNVYHVMPVNQQKFPNVKLNSAGAKAFAEFLLTSDTQRAIGEFGKDRYGQALFIPDAGKKEEELD